MNKELINKVTQWILTSNKSHLPYEFHAKVIIKLCADEFAWLENSFDESCNHNFELITEIDILKKDKVRLDWLSSTDQNIGNVTLPKECVENNIGSLRDAIDEAMAL